MFSLVKFTSKAGLHLAGKQEYVAGPTGLPSVPSAELMSHYESRRMLPLAVKHA
jgi:hypothetical protein